MFLTWVLSRIRAYQRYRQTVRELQRLSDRELNDVGLSRSDIDHVAKRFAHA
ncbi:DUF1127 domain-containing protein [Salinarimonas ramus]|uniref:YjiS-like domain-containing protein n=1 Tax=Salinarimonas ramus TaxID=690164 RepID=A0A917V4R9_9HYPH|nr:DUF1127 domain-containing protein [Salinarimonas ramus]GGK36382.1 hypothetical protein GCM10011322_24230 [Salinarimonas ramus]